MARQKKHGGKSDQKKAPNDSASTIFALILVCFFLSGLTGLIYEILWTRMIVKIIGSAPFAVSIVLTVFMGGLGLGSYLASRTIDRIKNPLTLVRLYGILELAIGAYGIILPLLLILFRPLYAIIYNHLFGYFLGYNLLTFAGCTLLLIIPVTCMGATLPVLSRFYVTTLSRLGTHVGRLYGLNTIGAAAGSLLCGFWLINYLGVWGSLTLAIILNVIIGMVCVLVSYGLTRRKAVPEIMTEAATRSREREVLEIDIPESARRYRVYALTIFAISGFCAMAYEVVWTKLLGLLVGPTTYSFTMVLVTFISALALGSIFFGWLGDRVKNVTLLLLFTQIAAALFALLFSQITGNSQIFFAKLIYHFKDHFAQLAFLKASILFGFMFFPTFCLGATFPLVGKIYTRSLAQTGRSIGFAYAINSVGAVLGAFCAGFLLIPLIGKEQSLSLLVAVQILTSLIIGGHLFWKTREKVLRWAPLVVPALVGLVLVFPFPHWDRKMLSIGKYHRFDKHEIRDVGWFKALLSGTELFAGDNGSELLYLGDGIGGFTTVFKEDIDILGNVNICLYNSGKPDASSGLDMGTQTLSAHLPMLFHPNPKRVLVVGLASGITAGEILYYPVEQLDVIDINEQVVAASDFFIPWNSNVLSNPRTELIIQDGRAHLELSERKYDVISSEPSNPWMAGLAALFTEEFFILARDRLNDDGIFVQWIHSYQMDWATFALVGRTFSHVFPNSLLVRTNPSTIGADFLLVGIKGEKGLDEDIAARNLRYAQQSKHITLLNHRVFYHLIVSEDLQRLFGEGPVNTDSRPWLEFSAPKLLHFSDPMIAKKLISNNWLGKETATIINEDSTDVDAQIDFVAYTLAIIKPEKPFKNPVDLSRATPSQRERFSRLMERFCANNIVKDFSFSGDEELKKRCVSIQIEAVREKINTTPYKAAAYIHLGNLYHENGMPDEAFRNFSEALRINPGLADAHYNMGCALARQDRTADAIKYYSEALRIKPRFADAHYNIGNALFKQGKTADAIKHYSEALRIEPDNGDVHNNMGNALFKQGRTADAIKHYSEALRIEPDDMRAHYNIGNALARQGRTADAIKHYSEALRIEPDNGDVHNNMGNALARQGRTADAIKHYSEALRLKSNHTDALNSLAWIFATHRNPKFRNGSRAVQLAEHACEITYYKHPFLLDTLAAAYAEAGRFEKARLTAQKAINLAQSAGHEKWVRDIGKRLQLYKLDHPFRQDLSSTKP